MKRERIFFIAFLVVYFVVLLISISSKDLWDPDETKYAQVTKEMLANGFTKGGHFITPFYLGKPYSDKPPLFFWLISLSSFVFGGINELSVRFPVVLSSIALLVVLYRFGTVFFNEKIGILSSVILATTVFFYRASYDGRFDVQLTLWIVLALYFMYRGFHHKEHRRRDYILSFVFVAIGVLTKGPLALVLVILVMGIYALFKREMRSLFNKDFLIGLAISVGIVLTWIVPACIIGGKQYTYDVLFRQTAGRYLKGWAHDEPFYFYFVSLPYVFAPWIVFLPSALVVMVKKYWEEYRSEILFLVIWSLAILLFFSFSRSKSEAYIIPMLPAAALITAFLWHESIYRMGSKIEMKTFIPIVLFVVIYIAAMIIIPIYFNEPHRSSAVIRSVFLALPVHLIFFGFAVPAILTFLFKGKFWSFVLVACAFLGITFYVSVFVMNDVNRQRSPRHVYGEVRGFVDENQTLYTFYFDEPSLYLYWPRWENISVLKTEEEVVSAMQQQPTYLLFKGKEEVKKSVERILLKHNIDYRVVLKDDATYYHFLLITNNE